MYSIYLILGLGFERILKAAPDGTLDFSDDFPYPVGNFTENEAHKICELYKKRSPEARLELRCNLLDDSYFL